MKQFFLLIVLFLPFCDSSRIENEFYDIPFPYSTEWNGDLSLFRIGSSGQIRLDAPEQAGEASLYTVYSTTKNIQWSFDATLDFNPSNANHARIYLFSDENKESSGEYYIQIGSNNDDVTLKNTSSSASLIQGKKGRLNLDKVSIRIKLILENQTTWTLYSRLSGENSFRKEGSYSKKINSFPKEGCFRINCRYSKTRSKLFSFDNIEITDQISHEAESPEEDPVAGIEDISCISPSELRVSFTKEMDFSQAVFTLSGIGVGEITVNPNKKQVGLYFPQPMQNGIDYTFSWKNLKYADGRIFPDDFIDFTFEVTEEDGSDSPQGETQGLIPRNGDIIFNELLYDPKPGGNEYIELYNRSENNMDISSLFIAVRKQNGELSKNYPLAGSGSYILKPNEYLLLSKNIIGVTSFYSVPEKAKRLEIPLPALSNTGASLVLGNSETEEIIDSLTYSPAWHAPFLKDTKGVSLERIDPEQKTHEAANWSSATTESGSGTPGSRNSQYFVRENDEQETKASIETPYKEADGSYSAVYHLDKTGYGCKATLFNASGQKKRSLPQDNALGKNGKLNWHMLSDKGKKLPPGLYLFHVDFFHPDGNTKQFKKTFFFQ